MRFCGVAVVVLVLVLVCWCWCRRRRAAPLLLRRPASRSSPGAYPDGWQPSPSRRTTTRRCCIAAAPLLPSPRTPCRTALPSSACRAALRSCYRRRRCCSAAGCSGCSAPTEACAVLACRVWTWYTYLHTRLYLSILVCDIIYTWRLEGVGTLSRRRRRGGCRQLQATTDFFLQLVVAVRLVRRMACVDARA